MRGQTTLAYLVMLAAILTIAVTGVVIFQSMLSPAEAANIVLDDKYQASIMGIELVDYTTPYQGKALTAPKAVVYNGESHPVQFYDDSPAEHGAKLMDIGAHKIFGKFAMNYNGSAIGLQSFYSKFSELGTESVDFGVRGSSKGTGEATTSTATSPSEALSNTMYSAVSINILKTELGLNADSSKEVIAEAYATMYQASTTIQPSQIKNPVRQILTSTGWLDEESNTWLKEPPQSVMGQISAANTLS